MHSRRRSGPPRTFPDDAVTGPSARGLRVVLADDQRAVRGALARLLAHIGHEVVAQAGDGDQAVAAVERLRPDVAVLDIRMPPTFTDEGLTAAAAINARHRRTGVVVLSQYLEATWAIRLMDQRTAGTAYALKDRIEDPGFLSRALGAAATGGSLVDETIVDRLMRRENGRLTALSDRERTVLALMAEGRSNRGIAEDLHLTTKTVESHVRAIFHKLDVAEHADAHRRVHAVLAYLDTGP